MGELRRFLPVLLLLAIPALLPFGRASELPLLVAAVAGVVCVLRDPELRRQPGFLLASLLFLGYWLPELAAAADALDRSRGWREVLVDLRFLPLLWFALVALRPQGAVSFAWRGLAVVTAAFAADGLLQASSGFSLGGGLDGSDRLSGIFGADDLKLGPVLAVLAPVPLLVAERRAGWVGFALAFALLAPVVLLAGSRAGWVCFALAVAAVLWHRLGLRRALLAGSLGALAMLAMAAASYPLSPRFAERVDRTAALATGDLAGLDHALAGRLAIWRAAAAMGVAHPVNGVGVRSFRVAYPRYAGPGDRWVAEGSTAFHAHQLVLEVWSETGGFGLLCWLAAALLAWRAWHAAGSAGRRAAAPAGIALLVMVFPVNTHLAFYSSFWGLLLFTLLALYVGALAHAASRADGQHPAGAHG
jgi:O-antigen ligase